MGGVSRAALEISDFEVALDRGDLVVALSRGVASWFGMVEETRIELCLNIYRTTTAQKSSIA